jgi:AcrR family transcriptional regulator
MARVTQAHIDARREEILTAARRLFLQHGFPSVTMQDIAREAGLSAGAIYRYYPSKDELVRAFFEHCASAGPLEKLSGVAPDSPPLERLRAMVTAVRHLWVQSRGELVMADLQIMVAGLLNREEYGPLASDAREQLYDMLTELVAQAQRDGDIDPAFDARALTITLHACVMGIGIIALSAGEEGMERQLDTMFGVFNDVLGRLGPASGGGAELLDDE